MAVIPLPFPKGGVDRRWNHNESPPLTTADALNVRCTESVAGRERGGSRPAFVRVYEQRLSPGGGQGINLMAVVRFAEHSHNKSKLVAAAGGSLYLERDQGGMELVLVSSGVSRWNDVMAVDFQNKLYIANTGRNIQGDWITKQTGTFRPVPDRPWIDSSRERPYSSSDLVGNDEANSRLALDGPPLVFDPITRTIADLEVGEYDPVGEAEPLPKGAVPEGCQIITSYHGRIVLAGDPSSPGQWYMSRVEDPTDWDYSMDDETAAVSGTTALAGKIGAPITALVPHADLCMVFACRTSLWILRGDPITGRMDNLSQEIGIIDKNAWCQTADGTLVFLSHDGVYVLPSECSAGRPESLSREKLPEELLGVDPNLFTVNLIYDVRARGVHICCTPRYTDYESINWFIDWETKGFWPVSVERDFDPTDCCYRRDIATNKSTAWFGCRDGYIRYFDEDEEEDDEDTPFDSYVMIGPFKGGDALMGGILTSLRAKLASGSGDVSWEVMAGETTQEALEATASYSGTWDIESMQYRQYPRVRGNELYVKVSGTAKWAIDEVIAELKVAGDQRK